MKRFEFTPCPAIWIVYQDGRPAVWCTRKADAEKYRRWGKRKVKHHINIRRYKLASSNASVRGAQAYPARGAGQEVKP